MLLFHLDCVTKQNQFAGNVQLEPDQHGDSCRSCLKISYSVNTPLFIQQLSKNTSNLVKIRYNKFIKYTTNYLNLTIDRETNFSRSNI